MKRAFLTAGLCFCAALIPLTVFAKVMNPEYRQCMQEIVDRMESDLLDANEDYFEWMEDAMDERRDRIVDSWNIEDESEQRDAEREINRDYKEWVSDNKRALRDREDDIKDDFSDNKRYCKGFRA